MAVILQSRTMKPLQKKRVQQDEMSITLKWVVITFSTHINVRINLQQTAKIFNKKMKKQSNSLTLQQNNQVQIPIFFIFCDHIPAHSHQPQQHLCFVLAC